MFRFRHLLPKNVASSSVRFKRLVKEGGWVLAGQTASVLGALVLVRVLTEYLDPARYGELALGLTLGTLICQVSMSGVMPGIMRFYPIAVETGDIQGYVKSSLRMMGYGTLATLILASLLISGAQLWGYGSWLGLIAMATVFTQLSSYNATLSSIQNAARQRAVAALHGGLDPWLKTVLVVAIFHWVADSGMVVVMGYAIATFLILGSQIFFLRRLLPRNVANGFNGQAQWMHRMWIYSRPFTVINIFTWAQASSDRWALDAFSTTYEVGFFAVLMQLGYTPISMLIGLLTTFVSPILHQRSGDATNNSRNASVHRISWQLTLFCLLITLIAFFLARGAHEWIFAVLVGPDYRSVSYLLPWVLLAGGLFAAGQVLSLKLMSDMNTVALLWPKVSTAMIGVILNILGGYYAGLHGIVMAAIAFSSLHMIWLAVLAARKASTIANRQESVLSE